MTPRVARLRQRSLETTPSISTERAELITAFYRDHHGKHSAPVLRALAFRHLCEHKTLHLGDDELIVGERGPSPLATPTFPELTCHSLEDLATLDSRPKTRYRVAPEGFEVYRRSVIPYWQGRSLRERAFALLDEEWHAAYQAGMFTEFLEQRAPGHTVADGKLYRKGLLDFKREIRQAIDRIDPLRDPEALDKREQLRAMSIAADGAIVFAQRHARLALDRAVSEPDPVRRAELQRIARNCERVPAHAPRDLWEALQAYWFYHLGVITELNGWDAFNPGHLDQHLQPFYDRDLAEGQIDREGVKELLECFFIKFNNQPAPPKVGVTAEESGTYTDFANINLGGLTRDGHDGASEVSYLLLEVIDELHILQPSNNLQVSHLTPERLLRSALGVIRKGYGFPSLFNCDAVVAELQRQGKTVEDAREGGTSGCVEAGAFGKEAYILTGYFNLVKLLELALNDGNDLRTGQRLGPATGSPSRLLSFEAVFEAWRSQLRHFVGIKLRGNHVFERLYATTAPVPFLSIITDDCIARGRDYNAGGARYNTSYLQGVGIGSLTDALAAIQHHVFETRSSSLGDLVDLLRSDFVGREPERRRLRSRSPRYGNDDDRADRLMVDCFEAFFEAIDGRPNGRGGRYHVDMLPTTCHIYFGAQTAATPDGRRAGEPLSEGISPVQGADRQGPTAVLRSAAKLPQVKTGGTLLNMKLAPRVLEDDAGIEATAGLVRGYFALNGHHVQFNVVDTETLREAQRDPEGHRDLIVRVAGYSDYFCDISRALQDEIISRTEQQRL
jgi:pyruvate formate-lyase/glycerol dehydratase family glycyl radical enzyme